MLIMGSMKDGITDKMIHAGNSLVVQWLGPYILIAEGLGSVSGQGTKIPQAKHSATTHTHPHTKVQARYQALCQTYNRNLKMCFPLVLNMHSQQLPSQERSGFPSHVNYMRLVSHSAPEGETDWPKLSI